MIGCINIKSTPGMYYVQRNAAISDTDQAEEVWFNVERLNIGRAVDVKIGVFMALKPEIYQFSFSPILISKGRLFYIF